MEEQRVSEMTKINLSLHTLGRCISGLAQRANGKDEHVPYRWSHDHCLLVSSSSFQGETLFTCREMWGFFSIIFIFINEPALPPTSPNLEHEACKASLACGAINRSKDWDFDWKSREIPKNDLNLFPHTHFKWYINTQNRSFSQVFMIQIEQ